MDLEEARAEIRATDEAMRELFVCRMEAVRAVAAAKRGQGLPVEDAVQEERVVAALAPGVEDAGLRRCYERFLRGVMGVSKDWQRQLAQAAKAPAGEAGAAALRLLVINGPNLNLLGLREPDIYGTASYADLCALVQEHAADLGIFVETFQSNHEGELVDAIQGARGVFDGIIINPAAYTHTSVAIGDALRSVALPAVEVHLSDVAAREAFRQVSCVRDACLATISGHGFAGYTEAMDLLAGRCAAEAEAPR